MKKTIAPYAAPLAGALFLMLAAFYNRFPITYSDTSTYLASGFQLETPFDRPITYGLFLRLASLNGFSLWGVIFLQCLLLSVLLFLLVRRVSGEKNHLLYGTLTLAVLSVFSGVSWTASQLMPDVFTASALLALLLLLLGTNSRRTQVFLYVVFFLSVAMHMSHLLLFGSLLLLLFVCRKRIFSRRGIAVSGRPFLAASLLLIASIVTMGSALSKSKHVFFMGAMVEHGLVKAYLDEHCGEKQYRLCAYKDSLPERAYQFIWEKNSPFYRIGGWKETKQEFNAIIKGTLTEPKFIGLHIKASVKATAEQLLHFGIGDGNGSFPEGTVMDERVRSYFPKELAAYEHSRQNQEMQPSFGTVNLLYAIIVGTAALLVLFLYFSKRTSPELRAATVVIVLGILLNAWDCGTFANAIDRLGCKMMWLLPLLACLYGFSRLQEKRSGSPHSRS